MSKKTQTSQTQSINGSLINNDNNNIVNNEKWLEIKNIKRNYWKEEEELLLQEWADKAQCYEWMHFKTHEKYKRQNTWFTIPVIVLSTITGTANFAQERFKDEYKDMVIMSVGGLNIIAGIITTIYQYLKISELNESHKIAYTEWGKLYRNIKSELVKHPFDRENHTLFMSYSKKEFERLINNSPSIPKDIVKIFNNKHKKNDINKPEICNSVNKTYIYKMDEIERDNMIQELNEDIEALEKYKDNKIHTLSSELYRVNDEFTNLYNDYQNIKNKLDNLEKLTNNHTNESKSNKYLSKFIKSFTQLNGRPPTDDEINTIYNNIYDDNAEIIDLTSNDNTQMSTILNNNINNEIIDLTVNNNINETSI